MKTIFLKIGAFLGIAALSVVPFLTVAKGVEKITICHSTGSEKNPFVEITISAEGLQGHMRHEGDIIPAPAEGCKAIFPDGPSPL